jgi:hypothetical protein
MNLCAVKRMEVVGSYCLQWARTCMTDPVFHIVLRPLFPSLHGPLLSLHALVLGSHILLPAHDLFPHVPVLASRFYPHVVQLCAFDRRLFPADDRFFFFHDRNLNPY